MSVVLVDARHYGTELRRARRMINMNCTTVAKLLKITVHELHKYELGKVPIPPDLICVLLHRGLALSACKTYKVHSTKK
ncbi:MAG: helix-turn-helix transcriptional regulator [Alphaproteobacteria bacterium]|nr:helix-turn-helix transcriptional regulator [Alphaproteobacteria bacterium]